MLFRKKPDAASLRPRLFGFAPIKRSVRAFTLGQVMVFASEPSYSVAMKATSLALAVCCALGTSACSSNTPPPAKPTVRRNPPPSGPTRTDFRTIAKKLLGRCVGGGWIHRWRSTHADAEIAKPRIYLSDFSDQTKQDLDPSYLNSVLEKRMRMSGVYEMVSDEDAAHFLGKGKLLRMAERTRSGSRISVYTAVLDLVDPKSGKIAYSCEATVRGEM